MCLRCLEMQSLCVKDLFQASSELIKTLIMLKKSYCIDHHYFKFTRIVLLTSICLPAKNGALPVNEATTLQR